MSRSYFTPLAIRIGVSVVFMTMSTAVRCASVAQPTTAPTEVSITIGEPGVEIPADFVGLSFETKRTLAQPYMPATSPSSPANPPTPPRLFSADDKPLIAMFRTLGVRSLRIGGNTADRATVPLPTHDDIDAVFRLARAADVKMIYTLRLRDATLEQMADTANFIYGRYAADLKYFAIGNEPDAYFKTYDDYRTHLEAALKAVAAVAPEARFCGPCTTQAHPDWSANVARDFSNRRAGVQSVAQHFYPCGDGSKATDPAAAIDKLLSSARLADYEKLRDKCIPAAQRNGLGFRIEETNNFYSGGAPNASNTFASALWALDFIHWWAANGASGINFHSSDFFPLTPDSKAVWYGAFSRSDHGYSAKPLAYAMAAYRAAAPAKSLALTIVSATPVNLSVYVTARSDGLLFLTIINKSCGDSARSALVAVPPGFVATRRLDLIAPSVQSTDPIALGGKRIDESGEWEGTFTAMAPGAGLVVDPASAAVVEMERLSPARP